jgi:signal transduction histidine kinase/CheY-like chemotaxis protein
MAQGGNRLRTVRVPDGLAPVFARAEEAVAGYFRRRVDDPERGTIEIDGERYLLLRAASLSVEFFGLVRDLFGPGNREQADDFSRNLLFDLSHALGRSDARRFHERMELVDPVERLAAGPVHFSHTGWAFVDLLPESRPVPGADYFLVFDHPYSFEAEAWLGGGDSAGFPVCIMNSGYSSGWCQESFGQPLVSAEILCRARGDDVCRFVMAPPERIEELVDRAVRETPHLVGGARSCKIPDFFSRKRMEDDLRRARDELELRVAERTAELSRANARLQREIAARVQAERLLLQTAKLEAVGSLAGGIAHDFNNLIGVVIGHVSLLESRVPAGGSIGAHLAGIRQAGEEASRLTQQLLTFSRARRPRLMPVDLNELIRETAGMLERLIGEDITLVLDLGDDAGAVHGDPGQLRQVVVNLVVNARDAMPRGGTLRIETRRERGGAGEAAGAGGAPAPDRLLLQVSDTGTGMSGEILEQVFEPFFTTKDPGAGTGLGLPIVQRIVAAAGGGVRVSSEPGRGTTFRIDLPRVEPSAPGEAGAGGPEATPGGGEVVLVVEDQPALRGIVVEMLERLGYGVLEAADPAQALALAASRANGIDLLLTDVAMPGMNGRELAERLCRGRPETRVLYMSGYADDEVLGRDAVPGAVELLPKPFTVQELAGRVRKILDG